MRDKDRRRMKEQTIILITIALKTDVINYGSSV